MDLRAPATALAAGRIAYGAGLAVAPTLFAGFWIGERARDPRTRIMCRGFGARDLALGAGGLLALQRRDFGPARWWFAAQALSDTADLLDLLEVGHAIPVGRRRAVAGLAALSAGIGLAAAVGEVDRTPSPAAGLPGP